MGDGWFQVQIAEEPATSSPRSKQSAVRYSAGFELEEFALVSAKLCLDLRVCFGSLVGLLK